MKNKLDDMFMSFMVFIFKAAIISYGLVLVLGLLYVSSWFFYEFDVVPIR